MNAWLYLTTLAPHPDAWRFTWWQPTQPARSGSLREAADDLAGQPLTLLLPMEMASFHQVEVPARSGRWLKQAIQSALEEQVLDELDTLHMARGPLQEKRYCSLFAIHRDTLKALLASLEGHGLQPRELYLDADCLPGEEPSAIFCNDRWLIGNLPATRLALSEQERLQLPAMLPAELHWQGGDQCPEGLAPDSKWSSIDENLLLHRLHSKNAIDLRQGEFRYVEPRRLGWRMPATLMTLCFAALLTYTIGHRVILEQQTAAVHEQNISEFRQRFPDEQRIVNLRHQVATRQQQPSSAPQDIARRLEQLAEQWIASGGSAAAIRHVQYQMGEGWSLQVTAPAFADLEHIREGLTQQSLVVQSNSTVRDASGVSSQFRIGE